jgi:HlyD family secretion protein
MSRKKLLAGLIIVTVIAVIVAVSLRRSGETKGVEVETAPAKLRTIVQTVSATGKIQPMTQVNISADVSAKITSLMVKEGDWLEKGTLLLQLDRERYLASVESAEASLRAALANINLARENMVKAEKDYERTAQLHEKNLESQASLDAAYAMAEVEKARYQSIVDQAEQARAALKQTNDDLSKTTIFAPMSGTVSKLNKEVGEIALGSQFQEDVILIISNLQGMEALVDVDENDIVSLALNDVAEVEVDALPEQVFKGEVTEIANSAKTSAAGTTDQRTEFEVKVAVAEPGTLLRPGMTASAEIVTDVREEVLSVPIQSVAVRTIEQLGGSTEPEAGEAENEGEARFKPDKEGFVEIVWIVAVETAEARQVTTGIQGDSYIEIIDGLEQGEQVVVGSYRAISRDLEDGTAVQSKPQSKQENGE